VSILLDTVTPIFGIILFGFAAVRGRAFDDAGVKGLVRYVFNFAIPLLLFRSMATVELPDDIEWSFLISFYGAGFGCYFLGMGLGRYPFQRPLQDRAIFGMGAGFSNTVLMGLPIILTAFGPQATLPVLLLVAFHSTLFLPLTTFFIEAARGRGASMGEQLRSVGWELARNPIILGILAGLAANLSGWTIPVVLDRGVELLASSAIPCALFAMGASLASYPLMGDVPPAIVMGAIKLTLHPLLTWVLAVGVFRLEGIWVPVAVTMAAMPTGIVAYLFGARHDAAPGVAARTIIFSTVLSIATISLVLLLFHP
jgi:predicted permease